VQPQIIFGKVSAWIAEASVNLIIWLGQQGNSWKTIPPLPDLPRAAGQLLETIPPPARSGYFSPVRQPGIRRTTRSTVSRPASLAAGSCTAPGSECGPRGIFNPARQMAPHGMLFLNDWYGIRIWEYYHLQSAFLFLKLCKTDTRIYGFRHKDKKL